LHGIISVEINKEVWLFCPGWFNLLGQVAVTSGIDFIFANHLAGMCALSTGIYLTQPQLLATYGSELCPRCHSISLLL
jgi:hypothetical protein